MGITFTRLQDRSTKPDFLLNLSLGLRVSWDQMAGMALHFQGCSNIRKQSHSCSTLQYTGKVLRRCVAKREDEELRTCSAQKDTISLQIASGEQTVGSEAELNSLSARSGWDTSGTILNGASRSNEATLSISERTSFCCCFSFALPKLWSYCSFISTSPVIGLVKCIPFPHSQGYHSNSS